MCGIAAVLGPGAQAGTARTMAAALHHRGPDRTAAAVLPGAALGAARLAVTGPGPAGDQPMADASGQRLLVLNGEIHNHRALRAELPGHRFHGDSDTETLLACLGAWGRGALPRLEGTFAFVYVDATAGRVLVARDRFGVKSLYLGRHQGRWHLASEMKALLAAGVPARVDRQNLRAAVADYWVNGAGTPLDGVRRVLPGTVLEFDAEGRLLREDTWFSPGQLAGPDEAARLAALGPADWLDELDRTLAAAVGGRLPQDGDASAGVLCSGGLDSSLVLALAAEQGAALPAYVASFHDQPSVDETRWAAHAARAVGVPLVPVPVGPAQWREHFVASVWHFEYPLVHQNSVALASVAAAARTDGLRVLFSGEGADELFGGYPSRHHEQRAAFGVGAAGLETPARRNRLLHERLDPGRPRESDYERTVLADLDRAFGHLPPPRRELAVALAGDLRLFLSHGLNRLDKNLMQQSIEVREPFLATAVARFALNSPLERQVTPRLKAGLAAVAHRRLPAGLVDREKFGFNFSVAHCLADLEIKHLESGVLPEILSIPGREWQEIVDAVDERSLFRLWSAEIWCRLFSEGSSVADVEALIWR